MASDLWYYFPGVSEPPADWINFGFNDFQWMTGPGGIGHGDNDDSTVIAPVTSVYLRIKFNVIDTSLIATALLNIDFDDGFVAYLNGHEIERENIGTPGLRPAYNEYAILSTFEAKLPVGGTPAGFIINHKILSECLVQGENVLAIQVHNCSSTSSDLSSTAFLTLGIKNESRNYRETPSWFVDPLLQSSNLPLIVIDTKGQQISSGPKITAWLKVIDNGTGEPNFVSQPGTDFDGNMGIKIRGQSSQMFPKKNYSIETRFESGADSSVSLLGMPAESDWILYAPYTDKSLLRNAITYYLGRRMMRDWQPRFRFCEVYLNNDYLGIYMLIESIKRDNNRVNINKLAPLEISGNDLTGGYIIKADKIDGLTQDEYFRIIPSNHRHITDDDKFTYVYPKYNEIVSAQKDYIKNYLTETDNSIGGASFSDPDLGFRKYLDVNSFVDFQIMQELCNNVDGYRFSTFFYKDKDSHGGKLHAGPLWDFDLAYGNEDYTDLNLVTDIWLYSRFVDSDGGRIHWWARLMEDLSYRSVFVNRWKELRRGAFNTDSIMTYLDNSIQLLGEAVSRNFTRWPVIGVYVWPNYFIGNSYEEEVNYLREWVTDRMTWIDNNIVNARNLGSNENDQEVLVYPNPVKGQINLAFYLKYSGDIQVEIFDLTGRKALQEAFKPADTGYQYITFDAPHLYSGYYVLKIMQGNQLIGRKKILVNNR